MTIILKTIFALWYLPIFVGSTVILGAIAILVSLVSPGAGRFLSDQVWGWIVLKAAFVKLKVVGQELLPPKGRGGFIIFANHTSLTDIPTVALASGRAVSWVAKAALGKIPFFGWVLIRLHMLLDREGGPEVVKKLVSEATRRIEGGEVLAIFPEGTRSRDGVLLLPFKKGAFILAKYTGAAMAPMAIKSAREIWPSGAYLPRPGREIRVKIGPVLTPEPNENLGALTKRAQAVIQEMLEDETW